MIGATINRTGAFHFRATRVGRDTGAAATVTAGGGTYYFCSTGCRDRFLADAPQPAR